MFEFHRNSESITVRYHPGNEIGTEYFVLGSFYKLAPSSKWWYETNSIFCYTAEELQILLYKLEDLNRNA